jgi:hypothetical protein
LHAVLKQGFRGNILHLRGSHPTDDEVELALAQEPAQARCISLGDMEPKARMTMGEPGDDGRYQLIDERGGTADPCLPECRIGQEFKLLHAALELVEDDGAAFDEGAAIGGRLDPLGRPVSRLVRDGLADIQPRTTRAGGRSVTVVRLTITDAGRRALAVT